MVSNVIEYIVYSITFDTTAKNVIKLLSKVMVRILRTELAISIMERNTKAWSCFL